VEQSLLYIRPLYLRASGGRIPELKRVIVAHQNQIVMEDTLEASLERLFPSKGRPAATAATPGEPTPGAPVPPGVELAELAARAQGHYQRALRALRDGNWALYGEEIKQLGDVLERMSERR
jgi:uncharacterized membrane protein (UPF0182 family)